MCRCKTFDKYWLFLSQKFHMFSNMCGSGQRGPMSSGASTAALVARAAWNTAQHKFSHNLGVGSQFDQSALTTRAQPVNSWQTGY